MKQQPFPRFQTEEHQVQAPHWSHMPFPYFHPRFSHTPFPRVCPYSTCHFIFALAWPLTGGRGFPSLGFGFLQIPLPFPAKDRPQSLIAEWGVQVHQGYKECTFWSSSEPAGRHSSEHSNQPQTPKPSDFPSMEYWFQLEIPALIFGPF